VASDSSQFVSGLASYRCPIIGSPPPRKVSLGRQFTGQNQPRPAAARVRRIFAGKLSAEGNFYGGDPKMGYGAGDIIIRGRHVKSVIISSRADFLWGRHFNVTPAASSRRLSRRTHAVRAPERRTAWHAELTTTPHDGSSSSGSSGAGDCLQGQTIAKRRSSSRNAPTLQRSDTSRLVAVAAAARAINKDIIRGRTSARVLLYERRL